MEPSNRVFNLFAYGKNEGSNYIVVTPESVSLEIVVAAWSYAVRYTAKGLDLPDYEAASALLIKRHPSWMVVQSRLQNVTISLAKADSDIPESAQS